MTTIAERLEQHLRERGADKILPPGHVGVVVDVLDLVAAIAALREKERA